MISVLEFVKNQLPESLIHEKGYNNMAGVAQALPKGLSTFWGFECRLAEPGALSDILFEVIRNSRGHEFLAGNQPSSIDDLCAQSIVWQNLRRFAQQWKQADHLFYADIRNLWLEFDAAQISSSVRTESILGNPCIFFGPDSAHPVNSPKDRLYRLIVDAVAALELNPSPIKKLGTFIDSLPDDARLFQVGLMLARSEQGLRLCVEKIPAQKLPSWLASLGWKGDITALTSLVDALIPIVKKINIGINLTRQGPCRKIGLECYMDWINDDSTQWEPVLKYAGKLGLCLPRKMKGVLEYPGVHKSSIADRMNPDGTLDLHLFRRIHHLKFAFDGERTGEIKAYLAVTRPEIDLKQLKGKNKDGSATRLKVLDNNW